MPTTRQQERFAGDLIDQVLVQKSALDYTIDWIASEFDPEDVFDEKKLEKWAEENGYTKEYTI